MSKYLGLLSSLALIMGCNQFYSREQQAVPRETTQHFIHDAAVTATKEFQLATILLERTRDPDVRDLAKQIARDHRSTGEDLTDLGKRYSSAVPQDRGGTTPVDLVEFQRMPERELNQAFIELMIAIHRQDLPRFLRQANEGESREIRAFGKKGLVLVREHLTIALITAEKLKERNASQADAAARHIAHIDAPTP